jgi:hypothetical protein
VGVLGYDLLVPLELLPSNVTGMVVTDQYRPILNRLAVAISLSCATTSDLGAPLCLSENISASVHRIGNDGVDVEVNWEPPDDLAPEFVRCRNRQGYVFCAEPQEDLPDAAQLSHFGEGHVDRLLYTCVRVLLNLAGLRPAVARRQHET